jgi:hypothetical protein
MVANWQDYGIQIYSQFYNQLWERLTCWQEVLQTLLTELQELDFFTSSVGGELAKVFRVSKCSHYLFYH